ncbi:MAG TPA: sigma 54-interacting transcriptional regulator [Labilithrix sp.]|jgi:DNA-binding NtrC family response regulator
MSYDEASTKLRGEGGGAGDATEFELRVTTGPDTGKIFVVDVAQPSPVLVGKSAVCQAQLADPEVSRRHASFEASGSMLRVKDLGSTNGTFVNGVRVFEAALFGGESVQVGSSIVRVTPRRAQLQDASIATSFGPVLGASAVMRRLYPACERIAMTRVPVIVEGETGTGKELMAEALHRMGPRRGGPFVVYECATAIDVDRALFGVEGGALGVFEQANGGTLVLDEVADLPQDAQAKLLRAIDRNEIRRVGGQTPAAVDARIVATTQRDLDAEVQAGRFREDLYFRLAVARIELPPLARREGDIPMLVRHFWWSLQGPGDPPEELVTRLASHAWPGNVRELANAVARVLALGDIAEGDLPLEHGKDDVFEHVLAQKLPLPRAREKVVDAFERAYVARVLSEHGNNVSRAAAASGLALRYFQVLRARQAKNPRDT